MSCVCNVENPAQVYIARRPIARQRHRCTECGGLIAPGERFRALAILAQARRERVRWAA